MLTLLGFLEGGGTVRVGVHEAKRCVRPRAAHPHSHFAAQLLTPLQKARMGSEMVPHFPDFMRVAAIITSEEDAAAPGTPRVAGSTAQLPADSGLQLPPQQQD